MYISINIYTDSGFCREDTRIQERKDGDLCVGAVGVEDGVQRAVQRPQHKRQIVTSRCDARDCT